MQLKVNLRKKRRVWPAFICVLCGLLYFVHTGWSADAAESLFFDQTVTVTNGMVSLENTENNLIQDGSPRDSLRIPISKDASYIFHCSWTPDHGGIVIGCRLYDDSGEIVYYCTGEQVESVSDTLDLKKGTYTMELTYLSNIQDFKQFVEESGDTFAPVDAEGKDDSDYVFEENGTWNIHTEYRMEKESSLEYIFGFIIGIACGILLIWILSKGIRKVGGKVEMRRTLFNKDSYDERQVIARGKAYKVGFYTLLIYVLAIAMLDEMMNISIFMSLGGIWLGGCIALFLFAIVCIREDAYMSLYENPKGVILLFLLIGIINLIPGVLFIMNGSVLENGVLSSKCMNLESGILLLLIMFIFAAKVTYNNKHMDEEDEG